MLNTNFVKEGEEVVTLACCCHHCIVDLSSPYLMGQSGVEPSQAASCLKERINWKNPGDNLFEANLLLDNQSRPRAKANASLECWYIYIGKYAQNLQK